MSDAVPADSSPATTPIESPAFTPAIQSGDFSAFEREERAKANPTKPAESSPAPPVEQAVSTETLSKPPSEAATPKPKKAKEQNAETRVQELLAERAQLRRELELAKPPATTQPPSEAAPAPASEKFPDYAEYLATHPDAPLSDYLDARDDWRDAKRAAAKCAQETGDAIDRSLTEVVDRFHQQFTDVLTADPEFMERIAPEVANAKPVQALKAGEAAGPINVIASELMKSAVAPKLMEHWTAHPDEFATLQQVPERIKAMPTHLQAREHVDWIKREIGRLEGRLEKATAPSPPPTKTVSSAPPPGTTLGTRPSAPADAEADAVKRGDYAAVEKIWRAQDAAKSSRR